MEMLLLSYIKHGNCEKKHNQLFFNFAALTREITTAAIKE